MIRQRFDIDGFIAIHFGMTGYRVYAWLFPIYVTVEEANDPTRNIFEDRRILCLIAWPLRLWRDIQIRYLTWVVRNRDRVSNQ